VLLSTAPASAKDSWKPRSMRGGGGGDCPKSRSLCAALVLKDSLRALGGLGDAADFVALVDAGATPRLVSALEANGIVSIKMNFDGLGVFDDYVLFRKLYIFKLWQYERVLLLDIDGVVTGTLRFMFESRMQCAEAVSSGCDAVAGNAEVCTDRAEILAQQTTGTPVLTAYLLGMPSRELWASISAELQATCGGAHACGRRRAALKGWGAASWRSLAPHDWATRHQTAQGSKRNDEPLSWASMGAGFSDQGFVEYFFSQKRRSAFLVSKWTCPRKLHFLHFNVPPKPWMCPGEACQQDKKQWDAPKKTRQFGGHHCAQDWWWRYAEARPRIELSNDTCATSCVRELDAARNARGDPPGLFVNYTPGKRCEHLWEHKSEKGLT